MANIRVGRPDVAVDSPSHVKGVKQGNTLKRQAGLHADGTADARRSTGIKPRRHDPIFPIMPNLPPG